jgi:anaerobic ribonucleoside-triphosphate reductase activating protein
MKIQISGIVYDSIVDGPGFRTAIFVQGCEKNCPGCHNPQTHDKTGGKTYDTADIIKDFGKNPMTQGITLTGGEPFLQPKPLIEIAKAAREKGLDVYVYSGYTYEEILKDPEKKALLEQCDVLIDGEYIESQRSLDLNFRGSKNQRMIQIQNTEYRIQNTE